MYITEYNFIPIKLPNMNRHIRHKTLAKGAVKSQLQVGDVPSFVGFFLFCSEFPTAIFGLAERSFPRMIPLGHSLPQQ
jgi:hypothetical protein